MEPTPTCPGCGAPEGRPRFPVRDILFGVTSREFEVAACGGCGLEYLWPQPTQAELPGFYPESYWVGPPERSASLLSRALEVFRCWLLHDHVRFVRRAVREQRAAGTFRRLLDIGCGDGAFLDALGERPAIGLDVSADAAAAVTARGYPGLRGNPLQAPFAPGSFSIVTMFHFLEHVTPAADYLTAVRRLIAPGGRLIVQVPNVEAWQCRLLRGRWGAYDAPRHLVHYGTSTLRATLETNGFRVARVTQHSIRDNPITLANSLAPGLYPPGRTYRAKGAPSHWLPSLAYLAMVLASIPATSLEALFGRGAAVMIEAEPRT
jgi:SAM-dependent methyltransferase